MAVSQPQPTAAVVVCVIVTLACLSCGVVTGRSINDERLDMTDTYVDIGREIRSSNRIHKRSAMLSEIMGPLRRNVRDVDESTRSTEVYSRMRVLLSMLRMLTRGKPQVEILQFYNWDRTIHIDQLFYVKPKTIWEVRRVILAARTLGMRVRATGVGHSRSPLYVDEGNIMMDVRELERHDGPRMVLNDKTPERDFQTVTAMTGVLQLDLNKFMTDNKVTILSEPLNDQETLGGMVAVSTHGSTWNGLTYSGVVVEVRIMDSRGFLRRFSKETHPHMFKAVMCNLGMFGIMYDITIEVVPTFVTKVENEFVPLKDLFLSQEKLKAEITGNFMTELSWFPFNSIDGDDAKRYELTGEIPKSWKAGNDEIWVRKHALATEKELEGQEIMGPTYMNTGGALSGGSTQGLLKGRGSLRVAKNLLQTSFHYVNNAFPLILPPRWGTETSAAFILNVDKDFNRVYRALQFLVNKTETQIHANGTTPINALLPRFYKNHDCLLCPGNDDITMSNDLGHSLVIDFLAPPTQDGFYSAALDFVEEFKSEKVRPHWAKRHDNLAGIVPLIQQVFGNNIHEFNRQKRLAHVDPCDMFMNEYLLGIFGRNDDCFQDYGLLRF